jgi:hypothetical protein
MIRTQSTAVLPSGLWAGHYKQHLVDNPQEMTLEFADGIIRGDGADRVGDFTIEGEYRVEARATRMGWIKTYERAHSVLYLGTFDGDRIVGKWRVRQRRGRFALYPARKGLL